MSYKVIIFINNIKINYFSQFKIILLIIKYKYKNKNLFNMLYKF